MTRSLLVFLSLVSTLLFSSPVLPPVGTLCPEPGGPAPLPERHPCLLLTAEGVARLRAEITTVPWKKQSWERLKADADKFLDQTVELPPRAGRWEHAYVDSVSGQPLQRGDQIGDWQWEHLNPVTHQKYRGQPAPKTGNYTRSGYKSRDYDGMVLGFVHNTWAAGVVECGLAYQLTQDRRYAAKAREILLAYAQLYPGLPAVNLSGKPTEKNYGKVQIESLGEAVWLVALAQGADLIWPTLPAADRQLLLRQLFYPAVAVLRPNTLGVHNITCWENAAIGLVGLLAHDEALVTFALAHPDRGFGTQVARGITADGFWFERAPGYQFYTLHALVTLGQAAANCGYPVELAPLKKMFDLPLALASPALGLSPFNDSKPVALPAQSYLYEWAYRQYQDPRYAAVLQAAPRGVGQTRGPHFLNWALLYGSPTLPPAPPRTVASRNLPASGYALLSQGQGPEQALLYLKYGPHSGWHSHPDQLSFVLYKGAEPVALDPGINTYGDPAHGAWYKTTFAHNTFFVDDAPQHPSTGACLAFGREKAVDYVMAETRNAYDSVRFVRTIALLTSNLVLVVDQVPAGAPVRGVDIAYHQAGRWLDFPPTEPWPRPRKGFEALQQPAVAPGQRRVSLAGRLPSGRAVRVSVDDHAPVDLRTGTGPSVANAAVASVFFHRPAAAAGATAWCIALDGQPVAVTVGPAAGSLAAAPGRAQALTVRIEAAHQQRWNLLVDPDQTAPLGKGHRERQRLAVQ